MIESVLAQTYQDFELVIVDDASTDGTVEAAARYRDERIRLHRNSENLGLAANSNRSVALASGRYIKFLHADDLLAPGCLTAMVHAIELGDGVGMVFCPRALRIDEPDEMTVRWSEQYGDLHSRFSGLGTVNQGRGLFRQWLAAGLPGNWIGEPSTVMVRRECLSKSGLFSLLLRQELDWDLWLRLLLVCDVGFVDEPLVSYRLHGDSLTRENKRSNSDRLDRLWILESLAAYDAVGVERAHVNALRRREQLRAYRDLARALASGSIDAASLRDVVAHARYRFSSRFGRAPKGANHHRLAPES